MIRPFKIAGEKILRKRLRDLSFAVKDKIDDYLSAKALEVERDAIAKAPVDNGFLKNNIKANTGNFLSKTISSNATYSAYVEFGTGPQVRVPPGLEAFARQFKGERDGNSPAQPFFFPAYFKNVRPKKVERDIKRIIERG